jgi:hypothetical protein
MGEKVPENTPLYAIPCTRCGVKLEVQTLPLKRMTCILCNSCHMKWKEIEEKLVGHVYEDEMRKAFISFMNDLINLRNHTLRGL